jgi:hypothetical protein
MLCQAYTAKGEPCRYRGVDIKGEVYCLLHGGANATRKASWVIRRTRAQYEEARG